MLCAQCPAAVSQVYIKRKLTCLDMEDMGHCEDLNKKLMPLRGQSVESQSLQATQENTAHNEE